MLELIITYLKTTLQAAFPTPTVVLGLAEKIQDGSTESPAFYIGNDEYEPLPTNENYIYFRQIGNATEEENEEEAVSGCDRYITKTFPMVAIAYLPKNIYNTDNAYIDNKIASNIANLLKAANYASLLPVLKADEIHVEIGSIDTNRYEVWDQEYSGVAFAARLDHVYLSVEFDLEVSATESCLRNFDCNDDQVIIDGNTIIIIIKCSNPMPEIFDVENVTTTITDARLKGGSLEKIFLFMGGTEQVSIPDNIQNYDPVTGTITFANDYGGQTFKVQYFPNP